jgi:hypothetical protein
LINPVDDRLQRLRVPFLDREEIMIRVEARGSPGLDKGRLEGIPKLDWVVLTVSDEDLQRGRDCRANRSSCFLSLDLPLLQFLIKV